jgi:hypothetical protein
MGFSEGPHQGSCGNFSGIRFSENLHWGSCCNYVEIGFSDGIKEISSKWGSWKFRQNGVRWNFVEIKVLVEISSKLGFPKTCIEDFVEIKWK